MIVLIKTKLRFSVAGSQFFHPQNQISFEIEGRLRKANENTPLCAPLGGGMNAHVGAQNAIVAHPERRFFLLDGKYQKCFEFWLDFFWSS